MTAGDKERLDKNPLSVVLPVPEDRPQTVWGKLQTIAENIRDRLPQQSSVGQLALCASTFLYLARYAESIYPGWVSVTSPFREDLIDKLALAIATDSVAILEIPGKRTGISWNADRAGTIRKGSLSKDKGIIHVNELYLPLTCLESPVADFFKSKRKPATVSLFWFFAASFGTEISQIISPPNLEAVQNAADYGDYSEENPPPPPFSLSPSRWPEPLVPTGIRGVSIAPESLERISLCFTPEAIAAIVADCNTYLTDSHPDLLNLTDGLMWRDKFEGKVKIIGRYLTEV